jgi:hypothetical protein
MWSVRSMRLAALLVSGALLLALTRPALADSGDGHYQQVVNGYHIELVFIGPVTPAVLPVQVILADPHGLPVTEARVQVVQTLVAALSTGEHGAAGGDTHADGAADGDHASTGADDHADAEDTHAQAEATSVRSNAPDTEAEHGHTEPVTAPADPHDESVPHTHEDSSLFQLTRGETAGNYGGSVIFFQPGQYAVHVEFAIGDEEHAAEFVVDVQPPDPGRGVSAAFAGVNLAILATAAVIKRKAVAQAA